MFPTTPTINPYFWKVYTEQVKPDEICNKQVKNLQMIAFIANRLIFVLKNKSPA